MRRAAFYNCAGDRELGAQVTLECSVQSACAARTPPPPQRACVAAEPPRGPNVQPQGVVHKVVAAFECHQQLGACSAPRRRAVDTHRRARRAAGQARLLRSAAPTVDGQRVHGVVLEAKHGQRGVAQLLQRRRRCQRGGWPAGLPHIPALDNAIRACSGRRGSSAQAGTPRSPILLPVRVLLAVRAASAGAVDAAHPQWQGMCHRAGRPQRSQLAGCGWSVSVCAAGSAVGGATLGGAQRLSAPPRQRSSSAPCPRARRPTCRAPAAAGH